MEGSMIQVLSIEDNPADSMLMSELFADTQVPANLFSVHDGVEAMDFLRKKGKFGNAVRPDIILLDLNLPKKDGREVLREIKEDPDLMRIPVLVLSTSNAPCDVDLSYELRANAYFTKPDDLDKYRSTVKVIQKFWRTAALPNSRMRASRVF
jgi:two-component system, chemotaxis family, response regulator Rcp1